MTERLLHEPFAHAPLVLAEQHGPKPTIVGSDVEDLVRELRRYRHRGHRAEFFKCEDSFSTSGGSAMMITRWSSTDSATAATAHVFSSRTRVSPSSGTRSVTAYSQAPDGKRMVIDSEATGLLPPRDLARCQVGMARGRAVGSDPRVADFVLFETVRSGADARAAPVLARTPFAIGPPARPFHRTRRRVFRCPDRGTPCVPGRSRTWPYPSVWARP
jgi:hypothetical protein